jgi:DUF2911 family protein
MNNWEEMTMRRLASGTLGLAIALVLTAPAWAQRNPRGTAKLEVNGKTVAVEYGRPSLHGRTVEQMLSQLGTGDVWRLGADQATTFSTSGDLKFAGNAVPAGEYSLWARKEADNSWKLVFNKQHGQWGVDSDGVPNRDSKLDVAAIPLQESKSSLPAGQVTIALAKTEHGGAMTIEWGDMKLSADFE